VGLVEDDRVRVDVDAAGINACALGLDERDTMLHCCAVCLREMERMDVKTRALDELGVVEVGYAVYTSPRWRCSALSQPGAGYGLTHAFMPSAFTGYDVQCYQGAIILRNDFV